MFSFPVNITNNKEVFCKELTNGHYKNILKYLQNNDDVNLAKYFEQIISELVKEKNLNYIDKLIILLYARSISINANLEISSNNTKNTVQVKFLADKILEGYHPFERTIYQEENDIEVTIGYPLTITESDDILSKIHRIKIGEVQTDIESLTDLEKDNLFSLLPSSLSKFIVNELEKEPTPYTKLFSYQSGTERKELLYTFDAKENFELLKLCFSDNLNNFYYYEYISLTKLRMSLSDFLDRCTPNEIQLHIKNIIKENEHNKPKSKTDMPRPGLGVPG